MTNLDSLKDGCNTVVIGATGGIGAAIAQALDFSAAEVARHRLIWGFDDASPCPARYQIER